MSKIDFIKIKLVVSFRYICLIFFLPLIIIFGLIIKLIKPLILIRWSRLDNARIGHFATNIEIYLLEKNLKSASQMVTILIFSINQNLRFAINSWIKCGKIK